MSCSLKISECNYTTTNYNCKNEYREHSIIKTVRLLVKLSLNSSPPFRAERSLKDWSATGGFYLKINQVFWKIGVLSRSSLAFTFNFHFNYHFPLSRCGTEISLQKKNFHFCLKRKWKFKWKLKLKILDK